MSVRERAGEGGGWGAIGVMRAKRMPRKHADAAHS